MSQRVNSLSMMTTFKIYNKNSRTRTSVISFPVIYENKSSQGADPCFSLLSVWALELLMNSTLSASSVCFLSACSPQPSGTGLSHCWISTSQSLFHSGLAHTLPSAGMVFWQICLLTLGPSCGGFCSQVSPMLWTALSPIKPFIIPQAFHHHHFPEYI